MKLLMESWRKFLIEELVVPTDINKKAISVYDFDETIARSEGHIDVYFKGTDKLYKRVTTQAEYDKLAETGEYDFDFSNLEYITNPTELVPVTKNLRRDVENAAMQVMILTARAGNAEGEIQMYLDSIGIPTDDLYIVGCAGCDKGQYIEDVVRRNPTIEVVHFYDDSQKNIKDMQAAKERLADLKRIRFFMINQVGPDADIERKGSALAANKEKREEADLFAKPQPTAARHSKSMGTRGPGGRIVEHRQIVKAWREFGLKEGWEEEHERQEKQAALEKGDQETYGCLTVGTFLKILDRAQKD